MWGEETNQQEGDSISRSEIDDHVNEYYTLWENVVATIKALDVNGDNTTSLTDMRKVQHEMHLAVTHLTFQAFSPRPTRS